MRYFQKAEGMDTRQIKTDMVVSGVQTNIGCLQRRNPNINQYFTRFKIQKKEQSIRRNPTLLKSEGTLAILRRICKVKLEYLPPFDPKEAMTSVKSVRKSGEHAEKYETCTDPSSLLVRSTKKTKRGTTRKLYPIR